MPGGRGVHRNRCGGDPLQMAISMAMSQMKTEIESSCERDGSARASIRSAADRSNLDDSETRIREYMGDSAEMTRIGAGKRRRWTEYHRSGGAAADSGDPRGRDSEGALEVVEDRVRSSGQRCGGRSSRRRP